MRRRARDLLGVIAAPVLTTMLLAAPGMGAGAPPRPANPQALRRVVAHAVNSVPGEIILRLGEDVTAPGDAVFAGRGTFRAASRDHSDSLDRLVAEWHVRDIRPLFDPAAADSSLAARRAAREARAAELRSRFPARAARASRGAAAVDLTHVYVLQLPPDADVRLAASRFAADPHVAWASPNAIVRIDAEPLPAVPVIPDDAYLRDPAAPGFWREGSMGQFGFPDLWGLRSIRALEAWNLFADPLAGPGAGTVVAVVDTGLDANHPDISANVWTNPGEVEGNGRDDDRNGFVDDVHGWDFTRFAFDPFCQFVIGTKPRDNDPFDGHGHGTHVSGTIAAVADDGIGIAGVAPRTRLMPLKGIDDSGCGDVADLAAAIAYAADNGADVLNMSFGAGGPVPPIEDAVRYAYGLGVVPVAAAGNDHNDLTTQTFSTIPANLAEVITVAASDTIDQPAAFSNFGEKIDVAAPGSTANLGPVVRPAAGILSLRSSGSRFGPELDVDGNYLRLAGTSMASPHVAGLAALMLSAHPGLSVEDIRQALRLGAHDAAPPGFDPYTGYGRIDALDSLGIEQVGQAFIDHPGVRAFIDALRERPITVAGTAGGPHFRSYDVLVSSGNLPATFTPLSSATAPVDGSALAQWTPDRLEYPDGWQTVLLQVHDDLGRVFESRRTFGLIYPVPGWPVTDVDFDFGTLLGGVGNVAVGDVGFASGNEAVAAGEHTLYIWSAAGQLLAKTELPDTLYTAPSLGDLDGDGRFEVVVGSAAGVNVFHGSHLKKHSDDPNVGEHPIVLEDMDGDGALDIVSIDHLGRIYARDASLAPLSFDWPQQPVVPAGTFASVRATDLATGDLDEDGTSEVAVALKDAGDAGSPFVVYVYGADGSLRWSQPTPLTEDDFSHPIVAADLVIGDVDGDGRLEVVFLEQQDLDPAGASVYWVAIFDHSGSLRASWTVPFGATFSSLTQLALADLDGDGDLEIIVTGSATDDRLANPVADRTRLDAWHHTGEPVAGFPVQESRDLAGPPIVGDVDGDGASDIVGSLAMDRHRSNSNPVFAWHASGAPLIGWPRSLVRTKMTAPLVVLPRFTQTTLADLDGNGTLDMLAPIGSNEVHATDLQVPVRPRALQWPTARHDFRRSGRFEVPLCGNGVRDPDEDCDDGNLRSCDGCSRRCRSEVGVCGDGILASSCEECDDGNRTSGDGCDSNCTATRCGNGVVTEGEECDDGNESDTDACRRDCRFNACGDGLLHHGAEECDDGNRTDGDGCSADCLIELIPGGGVKRTDCMHEWSTRPAPSRDRRRHPRRTLTCVDDSPDCDAGATTGDGACTFRVALCLNVLDNRLAFGSGAPACHPSDIAGVRLLSPNPARLRDEMDRANRDALHAALMGLGGRLLGRTCSNEGAMHGRPCQSDAECDSAAGFGDGRCDGGTMSFSPPLAQQTCSATADIAVALTPTGRTGHRRLRLEVFSSTYGAPVDRDSLELICKPKS